MTRSLAGGPALPPGRRNHLAGQGTLLANAETFAQTAVLLRLGPQRFAETGTHDEPGTVLLTVGGAVARPGVVESAARHAAGHRARDGRRRPDAAGRVVGGYHGPWLAAAPDVRLAAPAVAAAGGTLGAGVVLGARPARPAPSAS